MGPPPPTMVSGSPTRPKSCCGLANIMTQALSVRWFIVLIAFVGVCCAVVGTVLGAMKASGREHLTVSLLMIGEWQFFSATIIIISSHGALNQTILKIKRHGLHIQEMGQVAASPSLTSKCFTISYLFFSNFIINLKRRHI